MENLFYYSNIKQITPEQNQKVHNGENSFAPFNIYLWAHGFAFIPKFKLKFKCIATLVLIILLFITFEGNIIYIITERFKHLHSSAKNRNHVVITFGILLEVFLRILLHVNRGKLYSLTNQMLKIYYSLTNKSLLPFKYTIFIILIFTDAGVTVVNLKYNSGYRHDKNFTLFDSEIFDHKGDNYYFGCLPQPYSTPAFFMSLIISMWSFMTNFFPIYFCSFCFILKIILQTFTKRVVDINKIDLHYFHHTYRDIFNLVSSLNQTLHTMILVTFIVLFGKIFHACYAIMFYLQTSSSKFVYFIFQLVHSSVHFAAMCLFSSAVTNSAQELKHTANDVAINSSRKAEILFIINKLNTDVIGFKLLDSLVIDKSLLLAAIGNLLTYGILIATFNINLHN